MLTAGACRNASRQAAIRGGLPEMVPAMNTFVVVVFCGL